jgi:hypothetical protein
MRRSTALPPLLTPYGGLPTECHEVLAVSAPFERRSSSVRRPPRGRSIEALELYLVGASVPLGPPRPIPAISSSFPRP